MMMVIDWIQSDIWKSHLLSARNSTKLNSTFKQCFLQQMISQTEFPMYLDFLDLIILFVHHLIHLSVELGTIYFLTIV